jgi:1-deoxy-D-xylulose-5-phosphate reductoisomerase
VAVRAFLDGAIRFPDIAETVERALVEVPVQPADTLDAVRRADALAREVAGAAVEGVVS